MRTVGYVATGLLLLALLIGVSVGAEVAGYKWYLPWKKDQQYALIRQSNQYVATQQSKINGLVSEYNALANTITFYQATPTNGELVQGFLSQQRAKVNQMCAAAALIQDDQVPNVAKPIMRTEGCWNGF